MATWGLIGLFGWFCWGFSLSIDYNSTNMFWFSNESICDSLCHFVDTCFTLHWKYSDNVYWTAWKCCDYNFTIGELIGIIGSQLIDFVNKPLYSLTKHINKLFKTGINFSFDSNLVHRHTTWSLQFIIISTWSTLSLRQWTSITTFITLLAYTGLVERFFHQKVSISALDTRAFSIAWLTIITTFLTFLIR